MSNFIWQIYAHIFLGFILIFVAQISCGYTNPADVTAINNLYAALGSPLLPGWIPVGGDPCADAWQGVQCDNLNISSIIFNAANLGGELGDNLGSFASIKVIDLSNNQIGGSIPSNLPVTMQQLFLSDNKFTGSIPSSLSSLSQLSAMSLNDNQLTGDIPDTFQGLTVLVNLDLSNNNLSGQLPPSLESVSSLTTLRLQNNQLSGTLDVLQQLPLNDLNVENNKFSGPIPEKLLNIPNFNNGTLQDALHNDDEKKISWNTRIRMALGAARALEYLHEFCEPPIIHRNFKSANVLLDDELAVHVSDCGLAPFISSGSVSQLSGQLLSAYGYGAPEFESGIYTFMSDVYSFGVVMLELLTGRKSYDRTRIHAEQFLVRWAIPQLHDIDALSRMVDPSLDGEYPVKSLSHFADIISRCVQPEPEFRPPMSEVVQDLIQLIRRE